MRKQKHYPPMREMLSQAEYTTRFHMPGHKGVLSPDDTTELSRTDDLYAPVSGIARAEALAAASCGAAHTIMLTGGSTAGLMAMLLSCIAPGKKLILPRNIHHAAISACIWGDIEAVFADDIEQALRAHPDARAVLVTRPDYYGRCMPLAPIVALAHGQGTLVLVDEAHGAHFSWWDSPQSAGQLGADAWVQSAHKTLPALTGAAWLHLSAAMDARRARRFLRMVQTSSPPFPILESLDDARDWMDQHGRAALETLCRQLADVRAKIERIGGYVNVHSDDPTRLVVDVTGRGYSGLAMQEALAAHAVDIEMADEHSIVCICTVFDKPHAFARLIAALRYIPQREAYIPAVPMPPEPGPRQITLRAAALGRQMPVPLAEAKGRVAAISAGMYPPGIPLVLPGEQVTAACVEKLLSLPDDRRFGIENDCIICVE